MCGRLFISLAPEVFRTFYDYAERPNFPPRYNVAPTQPVPVVIVEGGTRHFRLMRWGFWPGWLKDPADFPLLINARAESARDKPAFRGALRYRRCVFLADGFYEWRREGTGTGRGARKAPFAIRRADGAPMALAGLWETWASADGSEVDTAAILTCGANGTLSALHERMPVILAPERIADWLDAVGTDVGAALDLCRPCPNDWLDLYAVTERVNSARNEGPDLVAPLAPAPRLPTPPPPKARAAAGGQGSLF